MKCHFCGEVLDHPNSAPLLQWLELHDPGYCPAHRKCTDACEDEASERLSARHAHKGEDLNITK